MIGESNLGGEKSVNVGWSSANKKEIVYPFIIEDVSVIVEKRIPVKNVNSNEENKNDTNIQDHHEHHNEYFLEGMSSLLNFNGNLCTTLNAPIPQITLNGNPVTLQILHNVGPGVLAASCGLQFGGSQCISRSSDSHSRVNIKNKLGKKKGKSDKESALT
jgi:hypothetical protein